MLAYGNERLGPNYAGLLYGRASIRRIRCNCTVRARQREEPSPPAQAQRGLRPGPSPITLSPTNTRSCCADGPEAWSSRTPRVILYCWMRNPLRSQWVRGNCSISGSGPAGPAPASRVRCRTEQRLWRSSLPRHLCTVLYAPYCAALYCQRLGWISAGPWLQGHTELSPQPFLTTTHYLLPLSHSALAGVCKRGSLVTMAAGPLHPPAMERCPSSQLQHDAP
jgi:hypothetical protein